MTDWRSAELKHYGIKMRDGLTARSRESFLREMHGVSKALGDAGANLPFARRLIYKDEDWYALMRREHGGKPGYVADGMDAIPHINAAMDELNEASRIIGVIAMLEGGWELNNDGYSWSYHAGKGGNDAR